MECLSSFSGRKRKQTATVWFLDRKNERSEFEDQETSSGRKPSPGRARPDDTLVRTFIHPKEYSVVSFSVKDDVVFSVFRVERKNPLFFSSPTPPPFYTGI